ncbi:MAG TPA: hypothetical protein VF929_11165, partial [Gemmatimonadaceae bacterium]
MLPDTVVVFGPKTFSLGTAPAATFVEAFSVSSPDSGGYVLRVVNAPGGAVHVTDGNVALNGRVVILGQQLAAIAAGASQDFPVIVGALDTMVVTLRGAANQVLSVALVALPAPTFAIFTKTYTRGDGPAVVSTDSFSLITGAALPRYLCFRNGRSDGTNRNSNWTVTLNGTQVVGGTDINSNVTGFVLPVTLLQNNVMTVVKSGYGVSTATLTVCALATDSIKPRVTISAPTPSLITNQMQVTVAGVVVEQTAVHITLNGQAASVVPDTGGRTNFSGVVPLTTEGSNVITVSAVDANGNRTDSTRTVIRDTQAPVVTLNGLPVNPSYKSDTTLTISGTITDLTAVTANVNGQPIVIDTATHAYTKTIAIQRGSNFVTLTATDAAGNVTTIVRQVTADVV